MIIGESNLQLGMISGRCFENDLHKLKDVELLYVDVTGSRNRTERLLCGQIPNWLHSPVGISIGADGPEEIAVSIIAELIATKGGRN